MMASEENRLSAMTMRRMPVLAQSTACLKAFAPSGGIATDTTTMNPLAIAVAILTGLLSGDTPQSQRSQTFYHYGYASQAPLFSGGMNPGSYGTSDPTIVSGSAAQQLYALPPQNALDTPPDALYTITTPPGTPVQN